MPRHIIVVAIRQVYPIPPVNPCADVGNDSAPVAGHVNRITVHVSPPAAEDTDNSLLCFQTASCAVATPGYAQPAWRVGCRIHLHCAIKLKWTLRRIHSSDHDLGASANDAILGRSHECFRVCFLVDFLPVLIADSGSGYRQAGFAYLQQFLLVEFKISGKLDFRVEGNGFLNQRNGFVDSYNPNLAIDRKFF